MKTKYIKPEAIIVLCESDVLCSSGDNFILYDDLWDGRV